MKIILIGVILALASFSTISYSTEYIYRDLMANTLPSVKCEFQEKADITARKPYKMKRYSKKFCQTQGYGWGLEKIINNGEIFCNECRENKGLQKCHLKDVIVKCKRIRPGSVGMLPGKG